MQLTNTALAAKTTNEEGLVSIESVIMPELLNITVTTEAEESFEFNDQGIVAGTTNDLEIEIP